MSYVLVVDDESRLEMFSADNSKQLGVIDYVQKPFVRELLPQALERAAKAVE